MTEQKNKAKVYLDKEEYILFNLCEDNEKLWLYQRIGEDKQNGHNTKNFN